ncbi:MAG: hypothetical protein Alis3KO_00710 [Aliiglaciecola sp.]
MTMKKADRKQGYFEIMNLMIKGQDKQAFDKLAAQCGQDTGAFWLGNFDKARAAYEAKQAESAN